MIWYSKVGSYQMISKLFTSHEMSQTVALYTTNMCSVKSEVLTILSKTRNLRFISVIKIRVTYFLNVDNLNISCTHAGFKFAWQFIISASIHWNFDYLFQILRPVAWIYSVTKKREKDILQHLLQDHEKCSRVRRSAA